jgi:hypothetical protein
MDCFAYGSKSSNLKKMRGIPGISGGYNCPRNIPVHAVNWLHN